MEVTKTSSTRSHPRAYNNTREPAAQARIGRLATANTPSTPTRKPYHIHDEFAPYDANKHLPRPFPLRLEICNHGIQRARPISPALAPPFSSPLLSPTSPRGSHSPPLQQEPPLHRASSTLRRTFRRFRLRRGLRRLCLSRTQPRRDAGGRGKCNSGRAMAHAGRGGMPNRAPRRQ